MPLAISRIPIMRIKNRCSWRTPTNLPMLRGARTSANPRPTLNHPKARANISGFHFPILPFVAINYLLLPWSEAPIQPQALRGLPADLSSDLLEFYRNSAVGLGQAGMEIWITAARRWIRIADIPVGNFESSMAG
jgi:hypothetical protein